MAKKKEKIHYWTPNRILTIDAQYYIIYGERSNGKTYGVLNWCLEQYFLTGDEFAYIRRWDDDIKGSKGGSIFNSHIHNGVIKRLSKGKYNGVVYRGRAFYFTYKDETGNTVTEENPFCYTFALTMSEHYKSNSYPNVKNIIFDEFLTRSYYLPDEFITFQNLLSTIIRLRTDVKIFMLGNTVNRYSPYIREMGLTRLGKQLTGTIDVYNYGDTGLKVVTEYASIPTKDKKSNVYFAFDNPRLEMIKNGSWEIDIYPHYPKEYGEPLPKEIVYTFFVQFEDELLQCEIIDKSETRFLFIHPKTTPIKENETALIYSQESNAKPNYRRKITKPVTYLEKKITNLFARDKVFYSDNETGEVMRNYIAWCRTS